MLNHVRSTLLLRVGGSLALLAMLVSCVAAVASAQSGQRLIDQDPFDQITLDEANGSEVIKVKPISFPNRRVPEKPKSTNKITVQLLAESRDYEVAWRHIAKIELFEHLLVAELQKLTSQGNFDEAYEYLAHLRANYPQAEGLDAAHNQFLYQSAGGAFRQGKYAEALGLLEELARRAPGYQASASSPTLVQVLGSAADKLIGQYVDKRDFVSARALLDRLTKTYSAANDPFAVRWRAQLSDMAAEKRDAARAALAERQFVQAYDAFSQMQEIWPQVDGGAELAAEMAQQYPLVRVGVLAPAERQDARSIADPAARRTARLVNRQLFEFLGMGPEGGRYLCPFGDAEVSDDGLELTFRLRPGTSAAAGGPVAVAVDAPAVLTGYDLSSLLLASAASNDLAVKNLIESVQVKRIWQVDVAFHQASVLPAAVLQDVLSILGPSPQNAGPFVVLASDANRMRYTRNEQYALATSTQPAEIVEKPYDDPQRAVAALGRGEIDVLDHVFPGDLAELKRNRDVVIDSYGVPTSHFIVFRRHSPFLTNRTFRRALAYGSDRETILKQTVLKGASLPGFRVVSAPFPAPTSSGDAVAYGYDQRITPRPYDARLALTLRILGQREVKAMFDKREQTAPTLGKLTLAHPADEMARIACRALAVQWKAIGVQVELVELPAGTFVDEGEKYDMLYVAGRTAEPLVDAGRLFGAGGLAATDNGFIQLSIRQIESSRNWQQARQYLQDLHRLVHEDVTVLPLWQTYDHFAYRRSLQGIGKQPAGLYENVEQWRLAPLATGGQR